MSDLRKRTCTLCPRRKMCKPIMEFKKALDTDNGRASSARRLLVYDICDFLQVFNYALNKFC